MSSDPRIAREPTTHEIKIWPSEFGPIRTGEKRHEVRKFDRDYRVGDLLWLREWSPESERHTGNALMVTVTHITPPGLWGLPENVGVMSIQTMPALNPVAAWPFPPPRAA